MAFHLIVTCVSQKKAKKAHSILDPHIGPGTIESVFNQWQNTLSSSPLKPKKAKDLYKGPLWNAFLEAWGIVNGRVKEAHLWILSAGYGLINGEESILPYDITFQDPRDGVPSILTKITGMTGVDAKKKALQGWWELLIRFKGQEPASIQSLIKNAEPNDYFLVILSKDYLDATFKDLEKAIKNAKKPEHIAVISNNVNDPVAGRLKPNWLYADGRFVNLTGSNNTLVNAKIAKELLWQMFNKKDGLTWWSLKHFDAYLKQLGQELPNVEKPIREPSTDSQVENYIKSELVNRQVPFSKLHRAFRDSGRACEYTRFRKIHYKVKDDLKNLLLKKRPSLPVNYKKRKAKMFFFLPDWDDRVDPLFDFKNDESTLNRDPYEHDAYHYELYGTLNCDGILVSKSVLEENSQKKDKARVKGIHRFLRLPRNVPVFGDCGAFNYISEENPPYETDEILQYYEESDFDFGVSIDHLIVPAILKRTRYLRRIKGNWEEISQDEFEMLKNNPNTVIKKGRGNNNQLKLFSEEEVISEEIYLDEKEKQRRYDLTIENAHMFIKGHRKGNYSFTPIGAAQGWDPESYAHAVKEYQKMGYSYIALGGLVRSTTEEILRILERVNKFKKPSTQLHIFGVARLEAISSFMDLGVVSVDSAGMLRQAWLSSSDNYYSVDTDHYTAIRIPPVDDSRAAKEAIRNGKIEKGDLIKLESECLSALRGFDSNTISLEEALDKVMNYAKTLGEDGSFYNKYLRTLTDRPWKKCPCKLCKETGIDIVIFRRNNRNRRRGFHNTWVFFNKFRGLTDS